MRALSLSLPVTSDGALRGAEVENYFDNLLPDSTPIRERMRAHAKLFRAGLVKQ